MDYVGHAGCCALNAVYFTADQEPDPGTMSGCSNPAEVSRHLLFCQSVAYLASYRSQSQEFLGGRQAASSALPWQFEIASEREEQPGPTLRHMTADRTLE